MQLTSPSFENNTTIPKKFTCDGEDISPALRWSGVPAQAKSLALICDDPDAPKEEPWVHWVVYNLPPNLDGLDENVDIKSLGAQEGTNDFGKTNYGGPCPPKGKPHRYFFKLFALDIKLSLPNGANKQEVLQAMQGHVLQKVELIGLYERA